MWIFTTFGFFSVIADTKAPEGDLLWVRARVRKDLERLKERYLPDPYSSPIIELANRDYPYRVSVFRQNWKAAMVRIVNDLNYSNFKNEVERDDSVERHDLYTKVWGVMHGAERKLKEIKDDNTRRALSMMKYKPQSSWSGGGWGEWDLGHKSKKGRKKAKDPRPDPLTRDLDRDYHAALSRNGEPTEEDLSFAFGEKHPPRAKVVDFATAAAERKAAKERRKARKGARGATIEVREGSEGGQGAPEAVAGATKPETFGTADGCPCPYCGAIIDNLWDMPGHVGEIRQGDPIVCDTCVRTSVVAETEQQGDTTLVRLAVAPGGGSLPTGGTNPA